MLGCRDIGIRISEFHAKTEFIQNSDFFDPFDSEKYRLQSFLKLLQMKNQFFKRNLHNCMFIFKLIWKIEILRFVSFKLKLTTFF